MSISAKVRLRLHVRRCHKFTNVLSIKCLSTAASSGSTPQNHSSQPRAFPDLKPTHLSYYWDTDSPTTNQLEEATKWFERRRPRFLWSAPRFATMDFGGAPEVCFLGRSNVGKSSLLNALLGMNQAHISSKPGRTRAMNAYGLAVGHGQTGEERRDDLVVLDMPGYGKGAHGEWGKQISKYLEKRRQLMRSFLLIDAVHGFKQTDRQLIELLNRHGVSYQVVLSKVDRVLLPRGKSPSPEMLDGRLEKLRDDMRSVRDLLSAPSDSATGEVVACSSEKFHGIRRLGIDAVRFAMLRAVGLNTEAKQKQAKSEDIVSFEELEDIPRISR